MSDGPDPGTVLVSVFLILFGGCLALVGGGCTVFFLGNLGSLFRYGGGGEILLFLISLGVLAAGIFLIRTAFRMLSGPRD